MATLAGVLALRACVSNLLDPRTGEAIRSPIIALYEIEQVDAKAGANGSGSGSAAPLSALVLKDAAALPTESSAALDQNDPATLLLVQPPAHAALFSRPTAAEAAAAAATAAQRTLHFRVYHALPKEGKDGAAGGSGGGADDDMDLGFDADSDDEGSGQRFELLGSCALLASELAQAARSGVALELSLRNALSPLCSQTLKRAGTALTLHVRPASPSESGEERAFERLLELAHGDRFQGLPQRVAADETSHQALLALHLSALRLPVDEPVEGDDAVPRGDGAADQPRDDSVYLAAVFERDLRSGDMKLQGVTPWTRSNPAASAGASATALHFPGRICVDYFPGEMQLFQVSVYKFRAHQLARALGAVSAAPSPAGGAEAEAAAAQVPPVLFAMLREEERVGSCEFYLDYFGLESGFLVSQRAAAAQAHARGDYAAEPPPGPPALPPSVGRLTALPGRAHLLRLEMPLAHDVSSRAQADLARSGAAVVVGLDAGATTMSQNARVSVSVGVGAAAAAAGSVPDDLDLGVTAGVSAHSDEEISRMNQEQLDRAMRLLAGAGGGEPSKRADLVLPPNAVPDAADVDVSGAEDGVSVADSADMNARLLRMMQQGQTFLSHEVGRAPRAQKLFYVPSSDPAEPALPGLLYVCEVEQDPAVLARDPVALANLQCIDLCSMTDIFLGKQSPAFHADGAESGGLDGSDPAEDDSVSFSLVTSNSTSLNLEALSAKKRAAWILGLMGCLKQEGEEEGEEEQQ